jgi:hypothetical protein
LIKVHSRSLFLSPMKEQDTAPKPKSIYSCIPIHSHTDNEPKIDNRQDVNNQDGGGTASKLLFILYTGDEPKIDNGRIVVNKPQTVLDDSRLSP